MSPIIVMGVSGCGKTTVGRALAARLDVSFLDADDFHPLANVGKMRAGIPLNDGDRAPWLTALNHALRAGRVRGECAVLACSALKLRYRQALAAKLVHVDWIFLDGTFEVIAARMRARGDHYMPEALLRSQFEALERPDNAIQISVEMSVDEQVETALRAIQVAAVRPDGV